MATLAVGDSAPDFALPDQNGDIVRLSDVVKAGPVVLFFYPAAFTPGCTAEACHFRDISSEFAAAGIQRVGISADGVGKQKAWADKHGLDYPLLSDRAGEVAVAYGARRNGLLKLAGLTTKRRTYAIGADRVVKAIIASEFDMNSHADEAIAALT